MVDNAVVVIASKFICIFLKIVGPIQGHHNKMNNKSETGIGIVKLAQKRIAKLYDIDEYILCKEMLVLKSFLSSKIQNTMQMLEILENFLSFKFL